MFIELKPHTDVEWLDLRRKVLTASDVGVILGLNPWKSVKQMQEGKENWDSTDNYAMWLGRQLEPVVVAAVNRRLDTKFELFEGKTRSFFVNFELGLGATPDAGTNFMLLEAKTTKEKNRLRWFDNPPLYYITQLYTQLICTQRSKGYLAIMNKNLDKNDVEMDIYEITRHLELDNAIIDTTARYWEAVKAGKMFRVDRKQTKYLTLKFKSLIRRL